MNESNNSSLLDLLSGRESFKVEHIVAFDWKSILITVLLTAFAVRAINAIFGPKKSAK